MGFGRGESPESVVQERTGIRFGDRGRLSRALGAPSIRHKPRGSKMIRGALFLVLSLLLAGQVLVAQDVVHARVSYKIVVPPGGSTQWGGSRISDFHAEAAAVMARYGIILSAVEVAAVTDIFAVSQLFVLDTANLVQIEAAAKANPGAYQWRFDAINVYLVDDFVQGIGGVCSFPTNPGRQEFIAIQRRILNGGVGLAHEFGHYFNLKHTFQGTPGISNCANPSPGGNTSGDDVSDTPIDPFDTNLSQSQNRSLLRARYGFCTTEFEAIEKNVMSYYDGISESDAKLTRGQMTRMLNTARRYRSHVLVNPSPFADGLRITELGFQPSPWVEVTNESDSIFVGPVVLANRTGPVGFTIGSPVTVVLRPGEIAVFATNRGTPPITPPGVQVFPAGLPPSVLFPISGDMRIELLGWPQLGPIDALSVAPIGQANSQWSGLGAAFHGTAPRTSSTVSIERIPGLDTNGGHDWTSETVASPGRRNRNSGPRGSDPRGTTPVAVKINEVSTCPDYIELFNRSGAPRNLQGWAILNSGRQGNHMRTIRPFPTELIIPVGGYVVVGEDPAPPAELPSHVTYVQSPQPFDLQDDEYSLALLNADGRVVDVLRADSNALGAGPVHNEPRRATHWRDFTGAARRSRQDPCFGPNVVSLARMSFTDSNSGRDWREVTARTLGFANPSSGSVVGDDSRFDVVLTSDEMIINAGGSRAGWFWSYTFTLGHLNGTGPLLGLGPDALTNYLALTAAPGFSGLLDANGSARLDLSFIPAGLGIEADQLVALQNLATGASLISPILEYDAP